MLLPEITVNPSDGINAANADKLPVFFINSLLVNMTMTPLWYNGVAPNPDPHMIRKS